MVNQINLSKNNSFDLSKSPSINLAKNGTPIDLSKVPLNTLGSKPPLTTPGGLGKKPLSNLPKTGWEPEFTEPLENLDKISIPLLPFDVYYTPDEPADPEDCERYPNSPFCGGFPFSLLPVGFEPEIILDACNVGVSIQPVIFFIKLPQHQIMLRSKNCQPNKPPEPPPPETPSTVVLPTPPPGCYYDVWWAVRVTTFYPEEGNAVEVPSYGANGINLPNPLANGDDLFYAELYTAFAFEANDQPFRGGQEFGGILVSRYRRGLGNSTDIRLANGASYDGVCPPIKWYTDNRIYESPLHTYISHRLVCNHPIPDYITINPPPPPLLVLPPKIPPKKMDCCPQILSLLQYLVLRVSEIDERVKTLDEEVKKTNKCLGTEEYPASLPSTIINQDEGFLANFIAGLNDQVEIKNLTQLVVWFFERFDEIMGQWEIPIQIKDTDPTTPGDQPVGIKLPNLAEAQAEQFTMAFQSTVNIDLLINIATRILAEVGQIKQQGFKGYGLTQTLVDYFNYEYSENAVDMPLSFAPDKNKFDELLKETTLKVAYPEFTDKENFKVTETRLLEMAAIIKALNWRKVDAGSDIKEQIKKSVLARAKQLDDEVKRQQDDLDKFVADAEKGYPNVPGMVNPGEPYGEPYASRPIVKRVEE